MKKGRPVKSEIRQNMIEILYFAKELAGYDLYKIYRKIFPSVTLRSIYYNLKKGTSLEEFKIAKVEKQEGEYSWGPTTEKIYYTLGPNAEPLMRNEVKGFFEKDE